jgi:uncharacterized Zn-binding protein involved in type VI secretion
MGKPAARLGDAHIKPGGGGPILQGCPTVIIAGQPAARVGDKAICGPGVDAIAAGAPGVIIAGKAAARLGDAHACGGKIISGCPTVIIGDQVGGAGSAPVNVKMALSYSQQVDLSDFIGMDPAMGKAIENMHYEFRSKETGETLLSGVTDHLGDTARLFSQKEEEVILYVGDGDWLLCQDGLHDNGIETDE